MRHYCKSFTVTCPAQVSREAASLQPFFCEGEGLQTWSQDVMFNQMTDFQLHSESGLPSAPGCVISGVS